MPNEVKARDLMADLAQSTPGWVNFGPPARIVHNARVIEYPHATVSQAITKPLFPPAPTAAQVIEQAANSVPDISFLISDASTTEGDPPVETNKVLVNDGKINGTFPDGMGGGDYVLDLDTPEDSIIYAGVTFNPSSLAITSRFLGVSTSADFPESRAEDDSSGFLYWQLGFTYFDGDGAFRIMNTRPGDINFEVVYGSMNGVEALLPVDSAPGWIDINFT